MLYIICYILFYHVLYCSRTAKNILKQYKNFLDIPSVMSARENHINSKTENFPVVSK